MNRLLPLFASLLLNVCLANSETQNNQATLEEILPLTEKGIDELVTKTQKVFGTPGIAIAIVKEGKVIFSKGYGYANIKNETKVNANTLFQIASISKSMTTAALSILIDDRKLNWNDKVIDYVPEFRLVDPYATREFTIKDLLTHRSGLPQGAGDLLLFPERKQTHLNSVLNALKTIPPDSSFRDKFGYDNLLYLIAGEVVARVSGISWAEFIESRIFKPLKMPDCKATHSRVPENANQATPYALSTEGKLRELKYKETDFIGAAAGVNCHANGLAQWLLVQLNHGKLNDGTPLFSQQRHAEMWTPVTISRVRPAKSPGDKVNVSLYALGWGIYDLMGFQKISHVGRLEGMFTNVAMIPEKQLGVIVMTNQQNGFDIFALESAILASYLGKTPSPTFEQIQKDFESKGTEAEDLMAERWKKRNRRSRPRVSLKALAQTYSDPWYGDIEIVYKKRKPLRFVSKLSEGLNGTMKHFEYDTFIVEWDDRTMLADAYLTFHFSEEGEIKGLSMKGFDPRIDFSYDFEHLNFRPKKTHEK